MFKHSKLRGNFGETYCLSCHGEWDGIDSPGNSPCDVVAQMIRGTRGYYEYLVDDGQFHRAEWFLSVARDNTPLAFGSDGGLRTVYWNETGSTL